MTERALVLATARSQPAGDSSTSPRHPGHGLNGRPSWTRLPLNVRCPGEDHAPVAGEAIEKVKGLLLDAMSLVIDFYRHDTVLEFLELRRIPEPTATAMVARV